MMPFFVWKLLRLVIDCSTVHVQTALAVVLHSYFIDNFNYVNSPLVNKKNSFEFSEDLIEALSVQLSHQSSYTGYHILRFTLSPQASSFWNSVTT